MKKLLLTPVFCLALIVPISVMAQVYEWTSKANYGGGEIYDPFSFTIGNLAYVGTGRQVPNINRNDFWEYNPATNIWTQKSNFPGTGRYGAKGFSIGGFGYAGTGWDPTPTGDFYRYDPSANTWIPIANFGGTPRYTSVAFSVNNKGYCGLGYAPCKSDFWSYDPAINAWTQVASFTGGPRQAANSFVRGNEAFVGFGVCETSVYNDLWKYDAINNVWIPLTAFPGGARSSVLSFVIGDSAFVGFGNNAQNNSNPFQIFGDLWKYDINANSWSQKPLPPVGKRFSGVAFAINGSGYIGMGTDTIYNTLYKSDFWRYGLSITPITPTLSLDGPAARCANSVPAVFTASPSGPGYFYQWYANGSPIGGLTTSATFSTGSTATVHVAVSGNNVSGTSAPLQVMFFPAPPVKPGNVSGPTQVCLYQQGVVYSVAAVPNATGYLWTVPQGASIVSGQGTPSVTVNWGNKYANVSVIATNPCGNSPASKVKVTRKRNCRMAAPDVLHESEATHSLTLYPNPANTEINLKFESAGGQAYTIEIFDLNGKLVEQITGTGSEGIHQARINTGSYREGIYLISFTSENWREHRKIVIQH